MKLLIASDIHGSEKYAQIIKDAFIKNECDTLLLLGDLLYHGPRNDLPENYAPKKVIEILNSLKDKIIAVRGNCEAEVDQMVLNFPVMNESTQIVMNGYKIFATHGHHHNPDNLPFLNENDVFMFGHIHIPVCEKKDGIIIINPGSITLPKQNSEHSYGLIDNDIYYRYNEKHELLSTYNLKGDI